MRASGRNGCLVSKELPTYGQMPHRKEAQTGCSRLFVEPLSPTCCLALTRCMPLSDFWTAARQDDGPKMQEIAMQRRSWRKELDAKIETHRRIPTGIGSGAASVDHKLRALVHKIFAETQTLTALHNFLSQVRGFCTDSGTEQSLADVGGCSLQDVLPPWWGSDGLQSEELTDAGSEYVFPQCVIAPGSLHIIRNMCTEVSKRFWDASGSLFLFIVLVLVTTTTVGGTTVIAVLRCIPLQQRCFSIRLTSPAAPATSLPERFDEVSSTTKNGFQGFKRSFAFSITTISAKGFLELVS